MCRLIPEQASACNAMGAIFPNVDAIPKSSTDANVAQGVKRS